METTFFAFFARAFVVFATHCTASTTEGRRRYFGVRFVFIAFFCFIFFASGSDDQHAKTHHRKTKPFHITLQLNFVNPTAAETLVVRSTNVIRISEDYTK